MNQLVKFIISFAFVALTAGLTSYFSYQGIDTFYSALTMPPLTPPNNVFSIVWPLLYVLMVISYYMILNHEDHQRASLLFVGQLFLQILWAFLFFAKGYFLYGLICIILLVWTVFIMIKKFHTIEPLAAYLQYPYFIWLIFATYLTAGVTYLNGMQLN